ncbi:DUF4224 domain-containing protein [Pseudomonas neustonica]|jgi:hypothetical protein|uniref:DUF4224 domain-containing protein n=1 Tax=Pseudomonas neustonica TaxID=2487346 RepID=A0ABX9XER8_9PSED|nr:MULTISPECIES: DUF4224 domain-containing protein [Pseudomonas]ROZ80931.1 DUF4224 domain-containing protein [Pseudomonas sp. SSM44]ROZ82129.1 DUF4224 domain-containing protein [Pseudomonas neustonica]|tara:strand:- start:243 stop:449 length:207 start_codon:yes stop_codon:yes gene_type:complete
MSAAKVLEFEELQRITGYTRRADVEKTLRAQGIRIFAGRKGPWTTIDLVNQAGGLRVADNDTYGPDIV